MSENQPVSGAWPENTPQQREAVVRLTCVHETDAATPADAWTVLQALGLDDVARDMAAKTRKERDER